MQHALFTGSSIFDLSASQSSVVAADRLEAVRKTGLLDSPEEASFDGLTALASRLLNAPVSFLAIVDEGREFYKSQYGFPASVAQARQMEGPSFCHLTLDRDEPLVIDDIQADALWQAVPVAEALRVRSYVGVPLKVEGQTVGSFCVVDTEPRQWKTEELEIIGQLAASASRELNLRSALAAASQAAELAKVQARAREEILAVVAHDLRTPLQILQLSVALLQRNAAGEHDALIARMRSAVGMMKTMAEELLVSAVPDTGNRQPMAAAAFAADAVDMMRPMAERSTIALVLEEVPEACLTINYSQMLRVMGNLISNSLKYSATGGRIVVSGRRVGASLHLTVADNGIGMDEAEQARAFEQGWQAEPGTLRSDGVGLGLGIVKSLVRENLGEVSLTSVRGEGTVVTIRLPCR